MPLRCILNALLLLCCCGALSFGQTDYATVKTVLTSVIERELAQKELPAAYIALIDDQSLVWSAAFGFSDRARRTPASTGDVHRIASVSKLFTDIAVMQLVERGILDIDAPVTRYLPDFKPQNPFGKDITLRQLMTHRAGLVREPPVGNYFDPTEPRLAETVTSLNQTSLVYEPETRFKYSNTGIAVVGFVLEKTKREPFAKVIEHEVFAPLGLNHSSFEPRADLVRRKPKAVLWTYDGREFDVPTFQFGMTPAANMYSTTGDLATFMMALFNRGSGLRGQLLKPETLEAMLQPQFVRPGQKTGVGLGFFIGEIEGNRMISHSGDVYGFATDFDALPDQKLGVIVVNTMNAANAWSATIADFALRAMVAARSGRPLPVFPQTTLVDSTVIDHIQGSYKMGPVIVDFYRRGSKLYMQGRTVRVEIRQLGDRLMTDDKLNYGLAVAPRDDRVIVGTDTLFRMPDERPQPMPEEWTGLIGEYGWDYNTLYIHERHGLLHAQIEWYFSYPLREVSADLFAFPEFGLYHGEQLVFRRDAKGNAIEVKAAGVVFARRPLGTVEGKTFTITPEEPVALLRKKALTATPPKEEGTFLSNNLVEPANLDTTIRLDIRYASTNNFMRTIFYQQPRAFLQRPAAEALVRANRRVRQFGYGLLVYDAYRPWSITKMFWEATPPSQRQFVADPSKGSRHNRGCAVDIGLYDLATGLPAPMVSGYDEFSLRAYPDYPGEGSLQRWNRELLRKSLEAEGFRVYEFEWWHFDYKDWRSYPLLNISFDKIR